MYKNQEEYQYLNILEKLVKTLENTPPDKRQKGPQSVDAVTIGCTTMEFDLSTGKIPLLTTKKINPKNPILELLWVLTGNSKLDFLHEHNVHFWDQWATKEVTQQYGLDEGDVGRIYGPNWIYWPTVASGGTAFINQIDNLIQGLKTNPQWRRWWISAWNPEFIDKAFLAPCHGTFHCMIVEDKLELHHFQRSADFFIGVPFNIAFYATLLRMICQVTNLKPGKLVQITSDTHLYSNHLDGAKIQLSREPREFPTLTLDPNIKNIFEFKWPEHVTIENYDPHPFIKVETAL